MGKIRRRNDPKRISSIIKKTNNKTFVSKLRNDYQDEDEEEEKYPRQNGNSHCMCNNKIMFQEKRKKKKMKKLIWSTYSENINKYKVNSKSVVVISSFCCRSTLNTHRHVCRRREMQIHSRDRNWWCRKCTVNCFSCIQADRRNPLRKNTKSG